MTDRKAWRLTGAFAMIVGFIGVSVNSERALTTDQLVGLCAFLLGAIIYFIVEIVN